jgi:Bacterial Ig-like domain
MRLNLAVGTGLLFILACARMGPPAGGPEDKVPPKLVATVPESLGVYPGWKHDAEFRFDEVISEGGSPNQGLGTGDLEKLILLSPTKGIPVVSWKRNRITVHPREGWQPNRVYRLQLLPGLMDLRRNKTDTSTVLTFSTGGPIPSDTLSGLVIDWVQGRVARDALVELLIQPDSLVYRTLTDSGGRFRIGPMPHGQWTVFGALDQNKNLRRDRRESYDSAVVAAGTLSVPVLWPIPRDTVGPRILSVTPNDSVSATVAFSQPLDPTQPLDSVGVRLMTQKDSIAVGIRSLLPKPLDDSLQKLASLRADSLRQAADTNKPDTLAERPQPPRRPGGQPVRESARVDAVADSIIKTRPLLFDRLVLRVDSAFTPDGHYQLEIHGLRSAAGVAGDSKAALIIPKARPPAAVDSIPRSEDSLAQPRDSAGPPVAPKPAP